MATDYTLTSTGASISIGSNPSIMAWKRWADTHAYRTEPVLQSLRSVAPILQREIVPVVPAVNANHSYLLLADGVYFLLLADGTSRLQIGPA